VRTFAIQRELWVSRPRADVFTFFSNAFNLQAITPSWLRFEIITPGPITMEVRLRLHGLPFRWRTKITEWSPPYRFVDGQLNGPYTLWEHTHTFEERDGGTLCRDEVRYRPRGGALINGLIVRRKVERIFDFRTARLNALFRNRPGESNLR
jgi:ligand-binding SRPBCC domain-containing protein